MVLSVRKLLKLGKHIVVASRSKQKGSAFERDICRKLSLWISNNEHNDLLWRSAMSGGTATVARKRGESKSHQCGDISAIAPEGHVLTDKVIIECKHYKKLDWEALIYKNSGNISKFWSVLLDDCKHFNKRPFLILKQNGRTVLVGLNKSLKRAKPINAVIFGRYFYELDKICDKYTIEEFIREYN
jgi:Holliday junction resolvase